MSFEPVSNPFTTAVIVVLLGIAGLLLFGTSMAGLD